MSVPIGSTSLITAPQPPSAPPYLTTMSVPFVAGSTYHATEKQQLDLRMRQLFPDLWRRARAQAAAPAMTQRVASYREDWLDHSLPIKRNSEQQVSRCWQSHSIAWLQGEADGYQLKAQLFGISDPHNLCIGEVPIFIDGDAGIASELLPDYTVNGQPRAMLDFTGSPAVAAKCNTTAAFACVVPDENGSVNDQIDALLGRGADAYIYLSPAQMDSWVASRAESVATGLRRYVRLSASPVDRDARTRLGGIIAGGLIGFGLLTAGIVQIVRRCRGTAGSDGNDTVAEIPTRAAPARSGASTTPDQSDDADSSIEV